MFPLPSLCTVCHTCWTLRQALGPTIPLASRHDCLASADRRAVARAGGKDGNRVNGRQQQCYGGGDDGSPSTSKTLSSSASLAKGFEMKWSDGPSGDC